MVVSQLDPTQPQKENRTREEKSLQKKKVKKWGVDVSEIRIEIGRLRSTLIRMLSPEEREAVHGMSVHVEWPMHAEGRQRRSSLSISDGAVIVAAQCKKQGPPTT